MLAAILCILQSSSSSFEAFRRCNVDFWANSQCSLDTVQHHWQPDGALSDDFQVKGRHTHCEHDPLGWLFAYRSTNIRVLCPPKWWSYEKNHQQAIQWIVSTQRQIQTRFESLYPPIWRLLWLVPKLNGQVNNLSLINKQCECWKGRRMLIWIRGNGPSIRESSQFWSNKKKNWSKSDFNAVVHRLFGGYRIVSDNILRVPIDHSVTGICTVCSINFVRFGKQPLDTAVFSSESAYMQKRTTFWRLTLRLDFQALNFNALKSHKQNPNRLERWGQKICLYSSRRSVSEKKKRISIICGRTRNRPNSTAFNT